MEYKFLISKNNIDNKVDLQSVAGYSNKYQKILNNLLSIKSRGDSSVFLKLNAFNKDLNTLLDEKDLLTLLTKPNFKIKLKNKNYNSIYQDIKEINSTEELLNYVNDNAINIPIYLRKELLSQKVSLSYAKENILDRLKNESLTFNLQWTKTEKEIHDIYDQTNIWPFYIGTYFIKAKLLDKTIYAPLLVKEVQVTRTDNDIYLESRNSTVNLNDKLVFFLEQGLDISLPIINKEVESIPLNEICLELDDFLKNSIQIETLDYFSKFRNLTATDITNNQLIRTSGIVCMISQPSGGPLREAVLNLIKEDRIDNLISINPDNYFGFDEQSVKNLVVNNKSIVRICQTDPSQEKAIISSLENSTIIIGPPGTGKSQTIANILANILKRNKKALFISQKRVALEVVLERMKELQFFALTLVDNAKKTKNEKQVFYSKLKKFINLIKSNYYCDTNKNISEIPLVSKEQKDYWNSKNHLSKISDENLTYFYEVVNNYPNLNPNVVVETTKLINDAKNKGFFDKLDLFLNTKTQDINELAKVMNIQKEGWWIFKKYNKEFKDVFAWNLTTLDYANKNNLDLNKIHAIEKIQNVSEFTEFYNLKDQLKIEVPKTNKFKSDINELVKLLSSSRKLIFDRVAARDRDTFRKLMGRIEREYTQPSVLINLFKDIFKNLFNIVVATPETLATFVDFNKDKYNYVIFDEASQIFLEKAIPYISIADKIIIAGDDQQMKPSNWFDVRSKVSETNYEDENIDSLLEWAIANGIPKLTLELNYRSETAELTSFSSKEFYESKLKAVDNNEKTHTSIEVINVNGSWLNQSNFEEAQAMIEILKDNIESYKRIILLTLNLNQMTLVENLLLEQEPMIYQKVLDGDIILKNLENIQGDEADLVIVSIGYTKDSALSATYVGRSGGRNALNVAITRAKHKMIVLKSIESSEVNISNASNLDLLTFKNWLNFLELNQENRKIYSLVSDENDLTFDSGFEQDVYSWLTNQRFNKNLIIKTQYPIGSYRIDLAILDANTNKYILGIEVDGLKYHSSPEQIYNDLVRQNFIESKGYKLIRVSEVLWKTDKQKLMNLIQLQI